MKNIYALLFLFSICSCKYSRYLSSPTAANFKYIKNKGEACATANINTSASDKGVGNTNKGFAVGYDINAGYALFRHFYLTASYTARDERDFDTRTAAEFYTKSETNYKKQHSDIGFGYFKKFENKFLDEYPVYLHVNTSIGKGHVEWTDKLSLLGGPLFYRNYSAREMRVIGEVAVVFEFKKNLDLSYYNRFVHTGYSNINNDYTDSEKKQLYLNNLSAQLYYETGIGVCYIMPKLPISFNLQLTLALGDNNSTRSGMISLGTGLFLRNRKH